MEDGNILHRRNLADKFHVDVNALNSFSEDAIDFLINQKQKHFEILFDAIEPRVVFKKAKLFRDYFDVTGHKSSSYKICNGRLSLTLNRFENYISKKNVD